MAARWFLRAPSTGASTLAACRSEIRQKPGTSNSLGLVSSSPNEFSIYFHDTPSKSLFGRESRAFSHGCIRLGQPMDLAEYLLKPDTNWTADSIRTVMARKKEKYGSPGAAARHHWLLHRLGRHTGSPELPG